MVAEEACAEAVAAAKDCPDLDVGLHLSACNGKSLLPARQLRGLVDEAGYFPKSEVSAGLRYAFNRDLRSKLRDEFRAQIERHIELVGTLNHINGHHNLHLHPMLVDMVMELAAAYRVPCVRIVREPAFTTLALAAADAPRKMRDHFLFRVLSARALRRAKAKGIRTNEWTFGFLQTGNLTAPYVLGVLGRLAANSVTEFYFHPALPVDHQPPLWRSQITETALLTSQAVRAALDRYAIRLTTYRALARAAGDEGAQGAALRWGRN